MCENENRLSVVSINKGEKGLYKCTSKKRNKCLLYSEHFSGAFPLLV